jgi:hypothetical protein
MYEIKTSAEGVDFVVRSNDNGTTDWIPTDEANSDYQRYLRWLENPDAEEGGTL